MFDPKRSNNADFTCLMTTLQHSLSPLLPPTLFVHLCFYLFESSLKSLRSKIRSSLPDVTVNSSSHQFVAVVIHSVGSLEVLLVIFSQIRQKVNQFKCTKWVTWCFALNLDYFIEFCLQLFMCFQKVSLRRFVLLSF